MTTLEAKRIQKYVEDREKQNDIEKDLQANTWKDVVAKASTGAVEKAGVRRLNHQLYTHQSELQEEQRLLEKLNEREQAAHRAAQEALLAEQLAKLRDDKIRDEKERLRVRQESEELKLLERQLYQAYVNKERHLQLQQKRLEKHRQQMEQQRDKTALDEYTKQHDLEQKEKERQRLLDSARYLEGLRQQFVEKDLQKESEFQQFLKEKAVIDEVVRQIEEEDKRMVRERSERMERLKHQMEEELASRQRQRDELKMHDAAQDKLSADYAAELERRDAAIEAARQQRLAELRRLQERLADEMRSRQRLDDEERHLREQLEHEQRRVAAEEAERQDVERQLCRMQEQRRAIELQLREKEEQRRDDVLRREAVHKEMMEKLAEEERLELLTLAARRRRELEHRRQVEDMMTENRRRRDEEIAQLCSEKRELERLERDRLQMVERERRRLLEQHAVKLVDFLPKGVFRDRKELEEIGARSEPVERLHETEKEANYVNIC